MNAAWCLVCESLMYVHLNHFATSRLCLSASTLGMRLERTHSALAALASMIMKKQKSKLLAH